MQDGFCLFVADDVNTALEERKNKLAKYNLTPQPVPVIVATPEFKVSANYVSIDNNLYKIETPEKAIDICFKIYHTLDAQYPKESECVWTFIQKYISPNDKNFISVNELISNINSLDN